MAKGSGDLNFTVNFDTQQAGREIATLLQEFASGSEKAGNKLERALGGSVEQKLVIRTVRGDNGVKELKSELITVRSEADKLKNALLQANKVQPLSVTSIRQQINQASQLRDSIAKYGVALDEINRKSISGAQISSQWVEADARVKQLTQSLRLVESANRGLGGSLADGFARFISIGDKLQEIVGIFQSVNIAVAALTSPIKNAINALADLDAFGLSFKAIGAGAGIAATAFGNATNIALGLGVNIKTVREGFQQLSPVILNTGGNIEDVSKITESLSSRFVAFGLSADKSRRVMNGVIQAFAKGKLQAEELTQQISEADPAFKTDFAQALFKARGQLGALSSEIKDGTVKSLERLVKSGNITADVLRVVIPLITKSDVLFGKLGDSAASAVDGFRRGDATLNQVRTQFENLNQLSLERLANVSRPVITVFLELQAVVTDFVTRISKLSAVKEIVTFFEAAGRAIVNLTTGFLSLVELSTRVTGFVLQFVNVFAKIPGVLEIVAIAVVAKFLNPVQKTIQSVGGLSQALVNLAKSSNLVKNSGGGAVSGTVFNTKDSEVALVAQRKLREELTKPLTSGVAAAYTKQTAEAIKSDGILETLTGKQRKRLDTLQVKLGELTQRYSNAASEFRSLKVNPDASKIDITSAESTLNQLKKEINGTYKQISSITGVPIKPQLSIPTQQIDELGALFDSYQSKAVTAYANVTAASNSTLPAIESQIKKLQQQRDAAKSSLDAFKGISYLPGADEARTKFEQLDKALESEKQKAFQLSNSYLALTKSELDLADVTGTLSEGQKLSEQQLKKLGTAIKVNTFAYDDAVASLNGFKNEQDALTQQSRKLSDELSNGGAAIGSDRYRQLKLEIEQVNARQADLTGEIQRGTAAVDAFRNKGIALEGVLAEGAKSGKGFRGLETWLRKGAVEGRGLQKVIGSLGTGIIGFGRGIIDVTKGLISSFKEIASQLAITAVFAIGMQAFAKANEISAKEVEKNKGFVDSLNASTKELNDLTNSYGNAVNSASQNTIDFKSNLSGTDQILIGLGGAIKSATDALTGLFGGGKSRQFDEATGTFKETTKEVNVMALALAGAALGFVFLGGPIGAAIGGLAGFTVGLFAANASLTEIKEKGKGFRDSLEQQFQATVKLGNALKNNLGKAYSEAAKDVKSGKITSEDGFAQQSIAIGNAVKQYKLYNESVNKTSDKIKGITASLNEQKAANAKLKAELSKPGGYRSMGEDFLGMSQSSEQKSREQAIKQLEQGNEKENQLIQTRRELTVQQKTLMKQLNELKAAYPRLTNEMILNGNSATNLSEKYKNAKDSLQELDPKQLGAEFDATAKKAGLLKVQLEGVDQRAQSSELKGYIEGIRKGLGNGEIENSLKNIDNIVKSLEERSILLDISSPELPTVIAELTQAREKSDQLNGRKANIEIAVTTTGLQTGQLSSTQNNINRLISAYEQLSGTVVIGTPQFEQIKTFKAGLADLASYVAKTKLEIQKENASLQNTIKDNEIKINLNPGPLRESLTIANQANTQIKNAALDYAQTIGNVEQMRASGLVSQGIANEMLNQAGLKFKESLTSGAASIAEAARSAKESLDSAQSAYSNLVLSKPQFFTSEEIKANAQKIISETERYVNEHGIKVNFAGTPDQQLQQMADFLATRKEAEKLTNTISEAQAAIVNLDKAFAKLQAGAGALAGLDLSMPVLNSSQIGDNLKYASDQAQLISNTLNDLPKEISIKVVYSGNPPRFTGGPVSAGQAYTVNELGQEGFLSSAGRVSAINRPKNASWRPPSSGTVIPAHIWKQMKGNSASKVDVSGNYTRQGSTVSLVTALGSYLSAHSAVTSRTNGETARIQAHQAGQIEKLSRAINKLADKNWNIGVNVRNTGNTAYLDAINRII
jgi:tape measure domain-containing protein